MRRHIDKIEGAKHERGYVYNCHYHLIWCTKYRKPLFTTPALVDEMKNLLYYVAGLNEVEVEELEVMPDHVQMLISFKPKYAAANVVKALKGGSGRMFLAAHPDIKTNEFWGGHIWSPNYFMNTAGNMSNETVRQYIQNQYTKE